MKRNYWPLFFIGIFSFTFGMIVWTIYSAVNTPVHEDKTFLKSYHELDKDFNDIVKSNQQFLSKYDFKIYINKKSFDLTFSDMFLAQRAIEEKSIHKNTFLHGKNRVFIEIKDKINNENIKNANIELNISRPTSDKDELEYTKKDFIYKDGKYILEFNLPFKGNWNITGTFKIDDDTGYFYIKSNAI